MLNIIFIKELVQARKIVVPFSPPAQVKANVLTKALGLRDFQTALTCSAIFSHATLLKQRPSRFPSTINLY